MECRARIGHFHEHDIAANGVETESQPPFGIASRAFRNRFRKTCCSCIRSRER